MKPLTKKQMGWRAAQDLEEGMLVNIGIGTGVYAVDYVPPGREVFFQVESGIVGYGRVAEGDEVDYDLIDAAMRPVTLREGASVWDSVRSFAMIRGGHIDVTLLGAFEVAANGDLANWDKRLEGKGPLIGGAMDLAVGARSVRVLMDHVAGKSERPRLVERCSLPLTGLACVSRVYTDLAVIDVVDARFVVREIVPGLDRETLQRKTGAPLTFAPDCRDLVTPDL